ncbi:hypothetical protein AK812_SmicGene11047 [Symbiodinium microadriaticum]|uniref:Uncharacterized protein n=1 Tax=Symbiodinium microadriaticum TaxID=2951 RepID=A0A1Q9EED5_SYMMI|nr:hypothetical protein AK812_SmicGene11047 [Symbiodinium microadriaticum]
MYAVMQAIQGAWAPATLILASPVQQLANQPASELNASWGNPCTLNRVAMGAPTRHPDQRRSDPSRVTRRHSRLQGTTPESVPTDMQFSSSHPEKSSESQFDKPATSFSYHTLGSLDEEMRKLGRELPILPISRSQIGAQAPHADLPGMIRDETHLAVPKSAELQIAQLMPSHGVFYSLAMDSGILNLTAQILKSHSNLTPVVDADEQNRSMRLLADYPWVLYFLIIVPMLAQLVTVRNSAAQIAAAVAVGDYDNADTGTDRRRHQRNWRRR